MWEVVNTLSYHDTFNFVQDFETEYPQLVAEPVVGRNHGKTIGRSRGHYSGPTVWTGPTSKFFSTNTGVHIPTMETRSSTLASNLIVAETPAGWVAVPTYFTDPEVDAPTIVPGSETWTQSRMERPHWNEILDALQEDVDFCEDGETTIARDGAIAIPVVFYITDDGQEAIEENEVPQILLQARPAFRHPGYSAVREDLNVAQKSRGFFGPRRGASGRDQGPRLKRSSIQQLKLRTRCARCRKLGHWARECPEGNRGQRNEERYDRRAMRSGENSKGFITVAKPTERRPFFLGASWTFVTLDPGDVLWDTGDQVGLVGKQQLDQCCKLLAEHGLQVEWSQEKPESAIGIGGTTKPIGVVYVPVGLVAWI